MTFTVSVTSTPTRIQNLITDPILTAVKENCPGTVAMIRSNADLTIQKGYKNASNVLTYSNGITHPANTTITHFDGFDILNWQVSTASTATLQIDLQTI